VNKQIFKLVKAVSLGFVSFLFVLSLSSQMLVAAGDWTKYTSPEYGFSMLVPNGTSFREKEYGSGWGSLVAERDGVYVYAIAKLGEKASAAEIESFGVRATRVPASYWKDIKSGKNSNGWIWYKTVEARYNGKLLFGGYGVGSKGSYLVVLETTVEDFTNYRADYLKWYDSVRLLK